MQTDLKAAGNAKLYTWLLKERYTDHHALHKTKADELWQALAPLGGLGRNLSKVNCHIEKIRNSQASTY
jgi:hypothetical protein